MEVLPPSPENITRALEVLRSGGVVAHATETCYGLACDLSNPKAVEKLFAIKKRPEDQPVSALFASVEEAKRYVHWTEEAKGLADEHLPGPLTLILRLRKDAPYMLTIPASSFKLQASSSLGIRVSSHPLAQSLVQSFGSPLSTTSANLHGKPNPYSAEEIATQFTNEAVQPDLLLDSGTLPHAPPSTVLDLTTDTREKKVRRKGAIEEK